VVLQIWVASQSPLPLQEVMHADPEQANGAHAMLVGTTQVPLPLHVPAGTALPLLQVADEHIVPDWYLRHEPEPSQVPSVPQLEALWATQAESSAPEGTG
jgi:hypothetical protein